MLNYKIILFAFASVVIVSCKKDWIEVKSDKALDVPTSVEDFQAVLDNALIMNENRPSLGEISADNYYLTDALWDSWTSVNKNAHIWAGNIFNDIGTDAFNWNNSYRQVLYANIALEGIDKVGEQDGSDWNNVKGSALFYRGEAFLNLSQLFAKPYSLTFPDEPGIPLRLKAEINEISVRSSLQQTYDQILSDLQGSVDYLPNMPKYKTRPSKPAAYALLSRFYLVKQDYVNALKYADLCLKIHDSLLDYNTLNANATAPVPSLNREVIFLTTLETAFLQPNTHIIDSTLYKSYDINDLRKKVFYRANTAGQLNFIGTYTGGAVFATTGSRLFGGIATDEVYLTRAECYARTGNIPAAMGDLNALMSKRMKTGFFVPFKAANTSEALNLILRERRKETPFRGLRWIDLRRLNNEGANITLTRNIKGQVYTLLPNDPKYVLPIPPDVIELTGMAQNQR